MLEDPVLYVGIDETNNGQPNPIYVVAYSFNRLDVQKRRHLPKLRKKNRRAEKCKKHPMFTFAFIPGEVRKRIPPVDLQGIIAASLLYGIDMEEVAKIKIYLDGEHREDVRLSLIRTMLTRYTLNTELFTGPRLDEHIPLVNTADAIASHLYCDVPSGELSRRISFYGQRRREISF